MTANDPAKQLAKELVALRREVNSMSRGSQMSYRSIEGGSIPIYDTDGVYRGSLGALGDGTTGFQTFNGPKPPQPSAPILAPLIGGLEVTWDGTFWEDAARPGDFRSIDVHASPYTEYEPSKVTQVAALSQPGTFTLSLPENAYTIIFVTRSTSDVLSDPSVAATETPEHQPTGAEIDAARQATADAQAAARDANTAALNAAGIAAKKGTIYFQPSKPAADPLGLWIDSDDGNKPYTYSTTANDWVVSQDAGIKAAADAAAAAQTKANAAATAASTAQTAADNALSKAATAQSSADGKNKVFWRPRNSPPPDPLIDNDTWFVTDEGNTPYKRVGTTWVLSTFGDGALAGLNVGKLVTGSIGVGQRIIAGPATGTHAEMSSDGFRVFTEDLSDGIPNEVVRMGTSTNDFFGVTSANGNLVAAVDDQGVGRFAGLAIADDDIQIGGKKLSDMLWAMPWGGVGKAEVLTQDAGLDYWGTTQTNTEMGLVEFAFMAQPGRSYELTGEPFEVWVDSGDSAYLNIRRTTDGSQPLVTSPLFRQTVVAPIRNGWSGSRQFSAFFDGPDLTVPTMANPNPTPAAPVLYRMLLSYSYGLGPLGQAKGIRMGATGRFRFLVRDVGPQMPNIGRASTGGGTGMPAAPVAPPPPPAPARVTRTDTWLATWCRSWREGGQQISFDNVMYQGNGDSFNGTQVSACGFPDVTGALAGAEINKVELYLNNEHAWYNDGVDLNIQGHGIGWAPPGPPTYTGQQTGGPIVRFGKPEGKWVDITYWGPNWQSGFHRGITLSAPGGSADKRYYGRVSGLSDNTPSLRITYTK